MTKFEKIRISVDMAEMCISSIKSCLCDKIRWSDGDDHTLIDWGEDLEHSWYDYDSVVSHLTDDGWVYAEPVISMIKAIEKLY